MQGESYTYTNKLAAEWSCHARTGRRGHIWAFVTLISMLAVIFFWPHISLQALLIAVESIIVFMAGFRILAVILSWWPRSQPNLAENLKEWPHYTVLVPLYREAHMVSALVSALAALDYPNDKLDIVMICEADDQETCQAVKACINSPFRLFEVPPSQPRTKPKALNAAMNTLPPLQPGELITIYDAEDRPHPLQLKQAALAFSHGETIAAVQAPLDYYNDKTNALTGLFSLEYAALFHIWNPALARLGLIFTLGGTSNHIRRDILERAGAWDSHNVTEDADLGFRMSALNTQPHHGTRLKLGTISHSTNEEAVADLPSWMAQRARWLKGFMQTWAVHMRAKSAGPDGSVLTRGRQIFIALCLQITVGTTLLASFLHVPSLVIICGALVLDACNIVDFLWPASFMFALSLGYLSAMLMGIAGALRARKPYLLPLVLIMPLYWLLHFLPALMAAYEFITAPNYWRKTTHKGTKDTQPQAKQKTAAKPRLDPAKEGPI